ncbi:hypothetical protein GA0115261_112621, partial [Streptomyces sp. OspMP-M43]
MKMSQSHQQPALAKCPGCEEPPAAGDLFCGVCGYDLSAVPARPDDRPTMAITVPPAAPAAGAAGVVRWPAAEETDSSDVPAPVVRPADVPGTDSGGRPLTGPDAPDATPGRGAGSP